MALNKLDKTTKDYLLLETFNDEKSKILLLLVDKINEIVDWINSQ